METPKTPRRVTFGGELIKIRSPDASDELEIIKSTGIPIPIKPALSIPKHPKDEMDKKLTKLPYSRQVNCFIICNYSNKYTYFMFYVYV